MIRPLTGLLCSLALATATPAGPGEAALRFLGRIGDGKVDLAAHTALSPGTTGEKTVSIRQRLEHLGERLDQGDFEIIAEKTDGDLAAVLVSQVVHFDPATAQIHAIGLVRRDGAWLPAPLPASFENTGLTYHPTLGPAAERLESWMLNRRPRQLDELRAGLDAKLRDRVRKALDRDALLKASPFEAVQLFIEALHTRDLPATLALLGGLEEKPPEGWRESVTRIAVAFRAADETRGKWGELLDPHLASAPVHADEREEGITVSVGFFDPTIPRPNHRDIQIRQVDLQRAPSGIWRLRLPDWIDGDDARTTFVEPETSLRDAFPLALIRKAGPRGFPTPHELGETLVRELSGERFEPLLGLVRADDGPAAMRALLSHARLWNSNRSSRKLRLLLDSHRDGNLACALYCDLDPHSPEIRDDLISSALMLHGPHGWQLAPDASTSPDDLPEVLRPWVREALARTPSKWLSKLGLGELLGGLPAAPPPDTEAARRTTEAWLAALAGRDPRRALNHATLFDDERSARRLFTFLGLEFATGNKREILGIHRHGRWAAASIRHQNQGDDPPADLLHPIIGTAAGPRVLPEAILYLPDTRARAFLNNEVWKRLERRLPGEAVAELRVLLDAHTSLCQPEPETDD